MSNIEFEKRVYREAAQKERLRQEQQRQSEEHAYRRQLDQMNIERAERAEQLTREALAETRRAYRQNRVLIIVTACIGICTVFIDFLANFSAIASLIAQWLK